MACALAGAHHNGHRCGQAQGAGAGDHQHGNAGGEGKLQTLACQKPDGGGNQGDGHDHGDKHAGNPICQAGDGGLGAAGLLHQADDLGEGGVFSHLVRPKFQESGGAYCGGGYGVAGALFYGDAFTGEGTLIHRGPALQDGAVHGNPAPGPHQDCVAHLDLGGGDFDLLSVSQNGGRLRRQVHKLANGVSGFSFGPGLQKFAQGDEGEDHGGGLKVEVLPVMLHQVPDAMARGPGHAEEGRHAIDQGSAGANSNEGIHIGTPAPKGLESPGIVAVVQKHHRQGEEELQKGEG